jgi:hypothetical protein
MVGYYMAKFHIKYISEDGIKFGNWDIEERPSKKVHIKYSEWVPSKDLTGRYFGKLYVEGYAGMHNGKHAWLCFCSCGGDKIISGQSLRAGKTNSCGCQQLGSVTKHGLRYTKLYDVWRSMKYRCDNPNRESYPNYGGRGITYDPRWKDFMTFYADVKDIYVEGLSIDRIDNDGNYTKDNVRFATPLEQTINRRNTNFVEYEGERIPLSELAKRIGINYVLISKRYQEGDRGERLCRPKKKYRGV